VVTEVKPKLAAMAESTKYGSEHNGVATKQGSDFTGLCNLGSTVWFSMLSV
jgi:hypothetical protein